MSPPRSPQVLAKLLAYVLGRRPDEFGLIPDADGFVRNKDLLKALHEEEGWGYVRFSHLREVLLTTNASTFEMVQDRIRAVNREALAVEAPAGLLPKLLFTCIRRRAYPHVIANGLQPAAHARVTLSPERLLAERLGKRIDPDPVILVVNVQSARDSGVVFYQLGDSICLADRIPPECISGPPLAKQKADATRKPKLPESEPRHLDSAGSFEMDLERAMSPHVPESIKHRTEKRRRILNKRRKSDRLDREKPPWRK